MSATKRKTTARGGRSFTGGLPDEGEYVGHIVSHRADVNPRTQTPYVEMRIVLVGYVDVLATLQAKGEEVIEEIRPPLRKSLWLNRTELSKRWIDPLLRGLGWDGNWETLLSPGFKFDICEVHRFSCEHRENPREPGKLVDRWRFLPRVVGISPEETQALLALFNVPPASPPKGGKG